MTSNVNVFETIINIIHTGFVFPAIGKALVFGT